MGLGTRASAPEHGRSDMVIKPIPTEAVWRAALQEALASIGLDAEPGLPKGARLHTLSTRCAAHDRDCALAGRTLSCPRQPND